jgi:hypothetical protein
MTQEQKLEVVTSFFAKVASDNLVDQAPPLSHSCLSQVHHVPEALRAILKKNDVHLDRTDVRSQGIGRVIVTDSSKLNWAILDLAMAKTLFLLTPGIELPRMVGLHGSPDINERIVGSLAEWHLGKSPSVVVAE